MSDVKHTAISKALREADYDTNKLFDLCVEAAELIDQQHAALKHAVHWHDQLQPHDIARFEAVIAKASGEQP